MKRGATNIAHATTQWRSAAPPPEPPAKSHSRTCKKQCRPPPTDCFVVDNMSANGLEGSATRCLRHAVATHALYRVMRKLTGLSSTTCMQMVWKVPQLGAVGTPVQQMLYTGSRTTPIIYLSSSDYLYSISSSESTAYSSGASEAAAPAAAAVEATTSAEL